MQWFDPGFDARSWLLLVAAIVAVPLLVVFLVYLEV